MKDRKNAVLSLACLMTTASVSALLIVTPSAAQQAPASASPPSPAAPPAQAKPDVDSGTNLEAVTVTARRREERLIEVPVAAQVMTPQLLNRYALSNLVDIGAEWTNVSINQENQGNGSNIIVRGIGAGNDASTDSVVSIDVDGISTDRPRGVHQAIFDLSSVDVLKGPQSLYFGKNSPAGVIVVNSANPSDEFEGYAKEGYEAYAKELYLEGAVGGPINDQLKARIAFRVDDMFGGWVYNNSVAQPDPFHPGEILPGERNNWAPEWKTAAARLTLIYDPDPKFDAQLKFLYMHYQDDGVANETETAKCAPGEPGGLVLGILDPNSGCTLDGVTDHGQMPWVRLQHFEFGAPDYSNIDSIISGLTMNYRIPNLTFTSVTGVYWYDESNMDQSDPTVFANYGGYDQEQYTSVSEELRAQSSFTGRFNFTGGLFLQTEQMSLVTSDVIFDEATFPTVGADTRTGFTNDWAGLDKDHGHTESVFFQGNFKILSNLELAGGARYTHEVKFGDDEYTFVNDTFANVFPLIPEGQHLIGQVSASNWSPEVTLTWRPSRNITLYGAYKTGFESGGFSNPTVITQGSTGQSFEYKPETDSGGEIGLKASVLNGRLTGDVTLYDYTYANLQVTQFIVKDIAFLIGNAAGARSQGVEVQGNWEATDDLTLRGQFAYNHAYYTNFPGELCFPLQTVAQGCAVDGSGQNGAGQPLSYAPLWTGSVGFTFRHTIWSGLLASLSADLRYSGSYQFGDGTEFYQPSYILVDAGLHVTTPDHLWDFAVIGRNLGNTIYDVLGNAASQAPPGQFGGVAARTRQVYFEVTRSF